MKFLIDYFNLNKRVVMPSVQMPSAKLDYKVESMPSQPPAGQPPAEPAMPAWEQILMYLGTVIGVLFSSAVSQWNNGSVPTIHFSVTTLIVSAVAALFIFPYIFKKLDIDPHASLFFRFALFVQNGISWHIIFGAVSKTIGS